MGWGSLSKDYTLFRDGFLPAHLRGQPGEEPGVHAELRRARRFISLVLVIVGFSLLTMLLQLSQGLWISGGGAGSAVLLLLVALWRLRRGGSLVLIASIFIGLAALVGVALALVAGVHGMSSLFWVALAPTLALAVVGERGARGILVFVALLLGASVWAMYSVRYAPPVDASQQPGAHISSLLGAMCTFFFFSWAQERENLASIQELERKNTALQEARQAADAANRAKGEFLAAMSHEIRTPMNGVLGMTSVMLSGELPEPVRDGLLTIRQSGDALLVLLNDILDLSRIEAGKLSLELVPCDVVTELRGIEALFQNSAQERGNRLWLEIPQEIPPYLLLDPLRFRQIVLNLTSNAIKFTVNGEVSLHLSFDGGHLRFAVQDTGIGMSEEVQKKIFVPFLQGDSSTTRRYGGSGLGLAIVTQLVAAMKGEIQVSSEVGRGSRFAVQIPAEISDAPARSSERVQAASVRNLRILLAEDNVINRRVAALLLKGMGHQVTLVENGLQAVERAAAEDFDLVLMDCYMPEMDGFDATRKILVEKPSLPVLALTAAATPEERHRCLDCGMRSVLLKPINQGELQLTLAQIFEAQKRPPPPPEEEPDYLI